MEVQRIKSVDVGVSGNDPAGEEASELVVRGIRLDCGHINS